MGHLQSLQSSKKKSKKSLKKIVWPPFEWEELAGSIKIGVDEVGRGCLAGSVYAGAVILRPDLVAAAKEDSGANASLAGIAGLTDSKLLTAARRTELSQSIYKQHQVGIGIATVNEIEELNILWAAMLAMRRAVESLKLTTAQRAEAHVLVDGNKEIPDLKGYQQTTVVKGDLRVAPISAASIVAKVARDEYLAMLGKKYPQYGFEKHKGYSTKLHKDAIVEWGPCKEHRREFRGVREYL